MEVAVVEEVFVRVANVVHLHVGGQVIQTTAEHPFWLYNQGWTRAGDLKPGDRLLGHDSQWTAVDDLLDTGEYQTVYNLRVAEFHTYFVGADDWNFSVWAHNAEYKSLLAAADDEIRDQALQLRAALRDRAKETVVGCKSDGRAIYLHDDQTFAVGIARNRDGSRSLWVSSSSGGRAPHEAVADLIPEGAWVTGGRRPNHSPPQYNHAEQRLLRQADTNESVVGLELIAPTRQPCRRGTASCAGELSFRGNLDFSGGFD